MMEEHKQNLTEGNKEKDKYFSMRIFVFLGVAVAVLGAAAGVGVYRVYAKSATDKFSLLVARALNLPAVKVGSDKVAYVAYADDLKAIHVMRDYDKKQREAGAAPDRSPGADLTEEQMTDQVLWRLVNNLLVEKAAKKYGVTIEETDIQNLKAQMTQQFEDEQAMNDELMKRYGWTINMYEKKVMRPFILQTKLAQALKDDARIKEDLRQEAGQILEQVKNGADFVALAGQYNGDSTAQTGGDLGWFGKGDMVPEFEKAAYSLKKGEIYPNLVETVYGFHIIRLDDKKIEKVKNANGQTVNAEMARASQILFRFPDLLSYLDEAAKDSKIRLYVQVHDPFAELSSSAK